MDKHVHETPVENEYRYREHKFPGFHPVKSELYVSYNNANNNDVKIHVVGDRIFHSSVSLGENVDKLAEDANSFFSVPQKVYVAFLED